MTHLNHEKQQHQSAAKIFPTIAEKANTFWQGAISEKNKTNDKEPENKTPFVYKQLKRKNHVTSVAYSPCGGKLVVGGRDAIALVYDTKTWRILTKISRDEIWSVNFSQDGKYLLVAGYDKKAAVYDARTWELINEMHANERVLCAIFSAQSTLLAFVGTI